VALSVALLANQVVIVFGPLGYTRFFRAEGAIPTMGLLIVGPIEFMAIGFVLIMGLSRWRERKRETTLP